MNNKNKIISILEKNTGCTLDKFYEIVENEYESILSKKHRMLIRDVLQEQGFELYENIIEDVKVANDKEENKEAGTLFYELFNDLSEKGKITDEMVEQMLSKNGEYGRKNFGIGQYPILSEDRDYKMHEASGTRRYKKDPVKINGKDYYLMSQWRNRHADKIKEWYNELIK